MRGKEELPVLVLLSSSQQTSPSEANLSWALQSWGLPWTSQSWVYSGMASRGAAPAQSHPGRAVSIPKTQHQTLQVCPAWGPAHPRGCHSLAPWAELSSALCEQDQLKCAGELPEGAVNYFVLTLKGSSSFCLASFPARTVPAKAGKLTRSFQLPPQISKKTLLRY